MPNPTGPYDIVSELNMTELLEHFDSNLIFDIINEKLDHLSYTGLIPEPNIVASFEENFKMMEEQYPGDNQNIRMIRLQVYTDIINLLCQKFNLQFNEEDDNIDRYTAAYYLYDFLVCKRSDYITQFFTMYIINNRDGLVGVLNLEDYRRGKDSASAYGKRVYTDNAFGAIAANIGIVVDHIATLDVRLINIFQSVYPEPIQTFLDNAIGDRGNFFMDFYYALVKNPAVAPIIITNIRLNLQRYIGNISSQSIGDYIQFSTSSPEETTTTEG